MSNHHDQGTLQTYLDQSLSRRETAILESHLVGCAECRSELDRLRSLYASIESLPDEPIGTDLTAAVMAAVQRRTNRDWLPSLAIGELALAGALMAALVLWLGGGELLGRLGGTSDRIVGQLGNVLLSLSLPISELLADVPQAGSLEIPAVGELIQLALISPLMWWVVAISALTLGLLSNGLVLRRVRREG